MGGSPPVGWLLVVVGAATGLSCLLRTGGRAGAALGAAERRVSRAEGVKGLGMALMAAPGALSAQRPWGSWLLAALFAGLALWSVTALRPRPAAHHAHLAVGAAAMVYMAAATAFAAPAAGAHGGRAMPGMAGAPAGIPAVTGALLVYFAGYALWAGLRMLPGTAVASVTPLPAGATPTPAGGGVLAAPEWAAACRVSLGIGMFAMLLTM